MTVCTLAAALLLWARSLYALRGVCYGYNI